MNFFSRGKGSKEGRGVRNAHLGEEQEGDIFRRSRTLSGSLSNNVDSVNAKRSKLKSERLKLHQLYNKHKLLKASVAVTLLLATGSGFLLSQSLMFSDIEVPEVAPMHAKEQLKESIDQYVNTHPSEAFFVTFNQERATHFLQRNGHPEVSRVSIENNWLSFGSTILFEYRTPIAVWQINNEKYYVDSQGTVFQNYSGEDPELQIQDSSGYVSELARQNQNSSQHFVSYVGELAGELAKINAPSIERVVIPPQVRQLNLFIAGHQYPIYVNTSRDVSLQAQDIKHSLKYFKSQELTPEYIDVRVVGKAFYKL